MDLLADRGRRVSIEELNTADDLLPGIARLTRSSPATFDYMKKLLAAEKGG